MALEGSPFNCSQPLRCDSSWNKIKSFFLHCNQLSLSSNPFFFVVSQTPSLLSTCLSVLLLYPSLAALTPSPFTTPPHPFTLCWAVPSSSQTYLPLLAELLLNSVLLLSSFCLFPIPAPQLICFHFPWANLTPGNSWLCFSACSYSWRLP